MKHGMGRAFVFLLVAAAIGVGATYGWRWWTVGRFFEKTDNAFVRGDITAVSPRVTGYVTEVAVDDNSVISAGDLLLRIDDGIFQAELQQAQADLAEHEADLAGMTRRRSLQDALIREAEASLEAARAGAERTRKELARSGALVGRGWSSTQRHDTAVAEEREALADVARAEARLTAERRQLAVIESESAKISAEIARARASLSLAEINLSDTVIRAPIGGVVGNLRIEVGEYVRAGTRVAAIVPLNQVWVVANFKETQLSRMKVGQDVAIEVDTFPDARVTGRVDSLAPASGAEFSLLPPDNATGNFTKVVQRIPVKITLEPGHALDGRLRPGMSVRVAVDSRTGGPATRVSAGTNGQAVSGAAGTGR
jgi:membrane fusion protein (multidrug efflux system)